MNLNRTVSGGISSIVGVDIISVGQKILEYLWKKPVLHAKKDYIAERNTVLKVFKLKIAFYLLVSGFNVILRRQKRP